MANYETTTNSLLMTGDFYITINGRILQDGQIPGDCKSIKIHPRLFGGKGGFGSMLRAIGARIEKTTNHEACRDLNGRRMRDVNNEKKISEWLNEQDSKEKERVQRHNDRIERTLNPKMRYEDKDYTKSLQGNVEKVNEAIKVASTSNKLGEKRKTTEKSAPVKKSRMWLGMDNESEDSDDPSEDEEKEENKANMPTSSSKIINSVTNDNVKSETLEELENEPIKELEPVKELKNEVKKSEKPVTKVSEEPQFLCLNEFKSAEELQSVGLERLKSALMYHGMKCGGTLQQRAERLFLTKDKDLKELNPSLFVKKK